MHSYYVPELVSIGRCANVTGKLIWFAHNFNLCAKEMKLPSQKLVALCREIGCKLVTKKSTATEANPKGSMIAELSVPLHFPQQKKLKK